MQYRGQETKLYNWTMQQLKIGSLNSDRYTQITDTTWEEYRRLVLPNQLVSYLNGTISIMAPGRNHEIIGDLLRAIIWAYCRATETPLFTYNQTRLTAEGKEGKEPDLAYCVGEDGETPDLAVEVNLTSGSINDLSKYKYLKVAEVWLWERDRVRFFAYQNEGYLEIRSSNFISGMTVERATTIVNECFGGDLLQVDRYFDR